MIAAMRLAWRLQRWEMAFVVIGVLGLAGMAFWQAFDMRSMLTGCGTPSAAPACEFVYPFQESNGSVVMLMPLIALAPFLAGLLLGVPIVAREVEHRTALIAWPLVGSRPRWLALRIAPAFIIGVVVLGVLAVGAELMAQAYLPKSDLGFLHHGSRGVPLVMRGVIALLLAVVVGAVIGRVLPALLVGIALCIGLSIGLDVVRDRLVPSDVLPEAEAVGFGLTNPAITEVRYRTPDGQIISAQEGEIIVSAAYEAAAEAGEEPDPAALPQSLYYGIASARHPEVVMRESLALGAATLGLAGVAVLLVRRRRPE